MRAPRASTRSPIAASSGPDSRPIAPAKIHGWRLATTRSFPGFSVKTRRRLESNSFMARGTIIGPMARKQFHTRCQEEVYRQVKSHLDELVDEHFDDAEHCDFYLKYGSKGLEISIEAYQEDDAR